MKSAIEQIGLNRCTSCFACYNVCNSNAIEMKISKKGFYYPNIDPNKCINCSICSNYCPVISYENKNRDENHIKIYGAYTLNPELRNISSSGGISTEISKYVLANGGVVFGAMWNDKFLVEHIEIRNIKDLDKIIGSKYVQSNISNCYKKIKNIIEKERIPVAFFGLPCQVAAIKNIIKSPLLITVDLICHGVPSITVFKKYLKYISKGNDISYFNFRDKELGWTSSQVKLVCKNGYKYNNLKVKDSFFNGFICDLYINKSCYDCEFAKVPRQGDITIGDFWKAPEHIFDDLGVSLVLSNNETGDKILNYLKVNNNIKLIKSCLNEAIIGNPRITNGKLKIRKHREDFFKELYVKDYQYLNDKYIKNLKRNVYDEE